MLEDVEGYGLGGLFDCCLAVHYEAVGGVGIVKAVFFHFLHLIITQT